MFPFLENAFKPNAYKQSSQISAQVQIFRATAIMLATSRTRMNRVANKYYQNAMTSSPSDCF